MTRILGPLAGEAEFAFTANPDTYARLLTSDVGAEFTGPQSFPAPLVAIATEQGDDVKTFGDDFYERIHYSFKLADLGNVVGLQTVVLYVWNAFLRSEKLLALTPTNDEGIAISGGAPSVPYDFPALREVAWTFTVSTEGPANIDATYAFDWQTADDSVRIIGSRITAWSFIPDWSAGVLERLEWRTDVLQSFDAREQRRALRLAPRKTYEFEAFFIGRERRYAETTIWGWGARNWALPIWPDGQQLTAPVSAGATEILLDTSSRDFEADSLAILIADAFTFETVEIDEVQADRIILKRGMTSSWPANTAIWPARAARLRDRAALPRWSGDASGIRASFDIMEPVDATPNAGAATHRGYPVLERAPNWSGGFELELQRKLAELDNLIGRRVFDDESGLPAAVQRMRWTLTSRAEIQALRGLFYALRGRAGAAWVPTWAIDLIVQTTIGATATAIDVDFTDYERQINVATGRRDIRIELTNGTVFYRRVTSVERIDADTERLTIDTALGQIVTPAEIAVVSFMALSRLDSDAIEFAWWTGETVDVATIWRSFQHDV